MDLYVYSMIYPPFHTRKQNDGSDNEVPYFQES